MSFICESLRISFFSYLQLYRVRLRAINIIGHGPFSSIVKCQTKCLPPDAPRLECTSATCNTIKVKWTTTNSSSNSVSNESNSTRSIIYGLEMKNKDERYVVSQG